jgi:tetratricopeptide (TPR) repeat protein
MKNYIRKTVEKYAKVAITAEPNNEWMSAFFANYLLENNRPESALSIYQKLITTHPQNSEYYLRSVDCHMLSKKYQEAVTVYNLMEKNCGSSAEINLSKYELFEKLNNNNAALQELSILTKKYPENKNYLKLKARYFTKNNKTIEALETYKKVLAIDPEDTDANLAVLSKGEAKEKPNAYLMSLLPIVGNPSIDIDVKVKELLPYVKNLAQGNNLELKNALVELSEKLVNTHPNEAKAYSMYGDILINIGDLQGAIAKYEKTLKLNNKVFAVWEQLLYAYLETNDNQNLIKYSNQALDLFPNQAIVYYFASIAATNNKNIKEGISNAEEGILVAGGNKVNTSKLNTALALAQLTNKDYSSALSSIDKAMVLSENKNSFAVEIQGDVFAAQGDQAKAIVAWKKSFDMGNKSKSLNQKLNSYK